MIDKPGSSTISTTGGLEPGDIITFSGQYMKRSFWQWLKREPKQLHKFRVINTDCGEATIEAYQ